jgi:putative transposase
MMVGLIDEHRAKFGVEPICAVLPIAPSVYYEQRRRQQHPERRPHRERRDESVTGHIQRVWHENQEVYGVRKVWKELRRQGHAVARCTGSGCAAPGAAGRSKRRRARTPRPPVRRIS